jgi:predicted nucleic acid-binding protein
MAVFIDTNILLDVLEKRVPHHVDSEQVLVRCDQLREPVFIAWHGLATAFYIYSRKVGEAAAHLALGQLLGSVSVAYTGQREAMRAFQLPISDLEDAMQAVAADACGADCIVTRNTRDFTGSPVPVLTPQEFLAAHP